MMKSFTLLVLLASCVFAAVPATPTNENDLYVTSANDIVLQDAPIVDMIVTDPRFPNHVFTGTAASVVEIMKALKPELFNDTTNDHTLLSLDDIAPEKRACCGDVNCKTYYPGKNDRIPWGWCNDAIRHLLELDKASCTVAAAPACARVSCQRKCGIFLCNKIDKPVSVYCKDIAKDINKIGNTCKDGGVWGARDFDTHYTGVRRQQC